MPPQPFACSLKLLKRVGVEGRSEKGRRKRTMHQKRMRPEAMPAHTQTRRAKDKHTDKRQPTTQCWGFGPPEFSSTAHQTRDQERNSPSCRAGCLPARSLASALCQLERLILSSLYRKLSPAPDSFLLHSRASDLHWTFLACLSTGAITILPLCPGSVLFPRSVDPGRAPKCYAHCLNP